MGFDKEQAMHDVIFDEIAELAFKDLQCHRAVAIMDIMDEYGTDRHMAEKLYEAFIIKMYG